MEKLTFEPMKIEGQRKKNPHLMPCNITRTLEVEQSQHYDL